MTSMRILLMRLCGALAAMRYVPMCTTAKKATSIQSFEHHRTCGGTFGRAAAAWAWALEGEPSVPAAAGAA
jgi:hypothetical protein